MSVKESQENEQQISLQITKCRELFSSKFITNHRLYIKDGGSMVVVNLVWLS